MTSLVFGAALLFYSYYCVLTTNGQRFHVDKVLFSTVWGLLFLLNGLLGSVYLQDPLIDALIFGYVMSFFVGHTVGVVIPTRRNSKPRMVVPNIYGFIVVSSIVGMLAPYEIIAHGPRGLEGFVDSGTYAESIRSINSDVRTGQLEQSLLGKIGFAMPQAALVLLGIVMTVGRYSLLQKVFWASVACFPLIIFTAVSTIRGPIFLSILLLCAGVVAGLTIVGKEKDLFNKQYALFALAICASLFVMMVFFQSIRLKDYDFNRVGETLEHMRVWFASYIPAFGNWLKSYWDGELSLGSSSFRFLGGIMSGRSSYLDTFQSNIFLGNWTYGNASTMLRVVVNDFGIFGCAIFMFIWGAASRVALAMARSGSLIGASLFASNVAAIVWSPNQWMFLYGSRVLAPATIILYFVFKAMERRVLSSRHFTDDAQKGRLRRGRITSLNKS